SELAPGQSCPVQLALGAGMSGTFDGVLRVQNTDGASLQIPLHGKVAEPALSVSAPSASQAVTPGSAAKLAVTITNSGGGATGAIQLADAPPFMLSGGCAGRALGAGEQCTVSAEYTMPATQAMSVSAQLSASAMPGGSAQSTLAVHVAGSANVEVH